MSTNNGAGNVASRKRKGTTSVYQLVGNSSKRVALELFPTHKKQDELISHHVSQYSPGLNYVTYGGQNQNSSPQNLQSFTSLLNNGHYTDQDDTYLLTNVQSPLEAPEDPFEKLLKSQYEKMRETCKQYLNNKYNDLVRQAEERAEERASRIRKEKDMEMAHLRSIICYLENKLASDSARLEQQNEVIKNKNTELDTIRRKYIEQEEHVVHFKSQAEVWKEKADKAEEILWNATVSPRCHAPCCCEGEEDTALSFVGGRW